MPYDLSGLLVVAISSSALFDSRKEFAIFQSSSLDEYVRYQIENENIPLPAGTALPLIRAMLRLNTLDLKKRCVEVVILSHMEPEAGLRVMNSVEHYQLDITRAAFTGREPVAHYLTAYNVSLFLSTNEEDVKQAIDQGIAAGLLYDPPDNPETDLQQLRIAFDGDAVIFSDEAEKVFQEKGLEGFEAHEKANAERPLAEGPFAPLLRAIAKIQKDYQQAQQAGIPPIQTALVTARNSPAHERVIRTLRAWGIKIDEMFFLGGIPKDQVLKKFRPHIFFDDQETHAKRASRLVPSAMVPIKKHGRKKDPKDHPEFPFEVSVATTTITQTGEA